MAVKVLFEIVLAIWKTSNVVQQWNSSINTRPPSIGVPNVWNPWLTTAQAAI